MEHIYNEYLIAWKDAHHNQNSMKLPNCKLFQKKPPQKSALILDDRTIG